MTNSVQPTETIEILPNRYLRYPNGPNGQVYQAGERVEVTLIRAKELCEDPHGMPVAKRITE
jgi:hypothetical protein